MVMDFLSGLMKGIKPLMDATGIKPDESMQLTMLQVEVGELEGKKRDALAQIGQVAYNMVKSNTWDQGQLLPLCSSVDDLQNQLQIKRVELQKAQQLAEEKRLQEEAELAARTCPNCNEVGSEGTQFCQHCGSKLGIKKPPANLCSSCGNANQPDSRFCGTCGSSL